MKLDSYLELFTTMYGWAFANIIGEILAGTGLAALPFPLIIFNAWREAKERGMGFEGIESLLESVQTQLVTAACVMMLCFMTSPLTSLSNVHLSYTPTKTPDGSPPQPVTLKGGTGTGYDRAMADATTGGFSNSGNLAFVPIWWYSVMGLSSGVNNAFRAGLNSASSDIRTIEDLARMATIEDPAVLHEVQRFYSECFVPARSQYLNMDKTTISANGKAILAEGSNYGGATDVDWIGSQFMRTEPGFYANMRSYNPVPGWAIDFNRDTEYIQVPATEGPEAGYVNPDWGRPTCKQWWEASDLGVRERLGNHNTNWRNLLNFAKNKLTFTSEDQAKDSVARLAFEKANPTFVDPENVMGNNYGTGANIWRSITGGISTLGVGKAAFDSSMSMIPLLNALPMVQALLLMALYMFLPLITLMSGYDIKMLWYGGLAIFTVKFWAVMWTIAQWVDAKLIEAMYPGFSGSTIMQEITQIFSSGQPQVYKRMLLEILLSFLFIGLPLIWSAMMGWIGFRMGTERDMLTKTQGVGASAGKIPSMPRGGKK